MSQTRASSRSDSRVAGLFPSYRVPQNLLASLKATLPKGSLSIFLPLKAGMYAGLRNCCPSCFDTPPKFLKGGQRWRWMACHIATSHIGGRKTRVQ